MCCETGKPKERLATVENLHDPKLVGAAMQEVTTRQIHVFDMQSGVALSRTSNQLTFVYTRHVFCWILEISALVSVDLNHNTLATVILSNTAVR